MRIVNVLKLLYVNFQTDIRNTFKMNQFLKVDTFFFEPVYINLESITAEVRLGDQ